MNFDIYFKLEIKLEIKFENYIFYIINIFSIE